MSAAVEAMNSDVSVLGERMRGLESALGHVHTPFSSSVYEYVSAHPEAAGRIAAASGAAAAGGGGDGAATR